MSLIYNIILGFCCRCFPFVVRQMKGDNKLKKFAEGQCGLLERIKEEVSRDENVVWIHASSLGEFGVTRPIVNELKKRCDCTVIMTFFSPTGYEALIKHHPNVDAVFYLPLDTPQNAKEFLDAVHPQKAIFIISEYWINYLSELKKRHIPTFLISAVIRRDSIFFKWYGRTFKKLLDAFTHFIVLNESSVENLNRLGYFNVTLAGDPLFDNALTIASTCWRNPVLDKFAKEGELFIAGSVSDKKDLELVCSLANRYRDVHFVIVPHEISRERLLHIKYCLDGNALCYSECLDDTDFSTTQVLIIDFLGALAYLYRYGKWAYIGGGFTPYLHSLIEATVYGLPVAFGPVIHRKAIASELIDLGVGTVVRSNKDICKWFETLRTDEDKMQKIKDTAIKYSMSNGGSTSSVLQLLERG